MRDVHVLHFLTWSSQSSSQWSVQFTLECADTLPHLPQATDRGGGHAVRQEDVVTALALTGQTLMGQAVMVKSSEVRRLRC